MYMYMYMYMHMHIYIYIYIYIYISCTCTFILRCLSLHRSLSLSSGGIRRTDQPEHKHTELSTNLMRAQKKPWGSTKRAICLGRPLAASVDLRRTL